VILHNFKKINADSDNPAMKAPATGLM
jgi:hypothetical protein